jgi:hypothetical protein
MRRACLRSLSLLCVGEVRRGLAGGSDSDGASGKLWGLCQVFSQLHLPFYLGNDIEKHSFLFYYHHRPHCQPVLAAFASGGATPTAPIPRVCRHHRPHYQLRSRRLRVRATPTAPALPGVGPAILFSSCLRFSLPGFVCLTTMKFVGAGSCA